MPALSWGASSVSNLKSWAQNPVQRKPSESIHDQDLCLMETVSGLVAELKIHVEKIDESTGKSEVQSKESLSPNIFFGCLWISVEPIRRFRKKPLVQPARHSRGGSARQISPTVLSSHWNGMNWPYRFGGSLFSDMPRSSQNSCRHVADLSDLVEVVEEGQGCYSALTEEGTDLCFKDFGMGQNLFYYQGKNMWWCRYDIWNFIDLCGLFWIHVRFGHLTFVSKHIHHAFLCVLTISLIMNHHSLILMW